ncbi:MAG: radical SAM protein [Deltaproteobacteria bacterium]|nr:radical SAM protein [Deltaproteobacteria bacterium]
MNILLTTRCTRKCPYCFAKERVSFPDESGRNKKAPLYISESNFAKAIDFTIASGQQTIGILGGEPSLHPQFADLMAYTWSRGLNTRIFTNGMWASEQLEIFENVEPDFRRFVHLVLNINEPGITSAKEARLQEQLLERLGRHCTLSYNIYRTEFEPEFLVNTIKKFKTRPSIRLGVCQPLAQMDSQHIDVSDYRDMVPSLMKLTALCDKNNIQLGFDCGFTFCMFTAEELGKLMLAGARFKARCGPAIDIGTDLSTWACFPLSTFSQGTLLSSFKNKKELDKYFRKHFGRLYRTGALPECINCRYRKRRQCSGGCAAHVYRKLNL